MSGFSGRSHSEETRRKMREAHLGKKPSGKTRAKLSMAQQGENNPRWGKPGTFLGKSHTDEARQKNREAHLGKLHTEESKVKISRANSGKRFSPEHRAKIGAAMLGKRWKLGPEACLKMSLAHRGRPSPALGKRWKCQESDARQNILRTFASSLERFVKICLMSHNYNFIHQGRIPGFAKLAGYSHPWDFLIPGKRLAVELDGDYWHSTANPQWSSVKESEDRRVAEQLGWRVIRIPERVLRKSAVFQTWQRQEKANA